MTATSHPKRGLMRLTSMETLGFLEAPSRTWTTPPAQLPVMDQGVDNDEPTGLIALPVGRHSRHAQPSGELVRDIWDSTDLNAPSLLDWSPETFGSKHLGGRRFRWPMILLVFVLATGALAGGFWLYQEPNSAAESAMGQVRSDAEALTEEIDAISPLIDDLDADRLPEASRDASVFFQVGERARAMFAASVGLPAHDAGARAATAEAAGLVIEASRQLMDITAYRTALEPALILPLLETDPGLTDLPTATEAFTEWRSGFENVRAGLPSDIAPEANTALEALIADLEVVQTEYLDALQAGSRSDAVQVIGTLRANLLSVRQTMLSDVAKVTSAAGDMLDRSSTVLADLVG